MTIQKLKEYGEFVAFNENTKSWVYIMNNRLYSISKNGITKL